jgi:GT2 family glycosyltransferase
MSTGQPVRLSAQIVTWNSAHRLDTCLASLAAQTSQQFEVVVVDNASADGSADRVDVWLRRGLRGRLLRLDLNSGFCAGQNLAFEHARGDLILLLNPDVVLPCDFVEQAVAIADANPADVGTFAPCISLPDGRLDSTGLVIDVVRRAWDRDHGRHAGPGTQVSGDVFGCTGAAALHRRSMLDDVAIDGKPLDEAMFAYYDDLDLAWRARRRGWRCLYVPALTAIHHREARNALRRRAGRPTRGRDQTLMVRNRLLMIVKCERAVDAILRLPAYLAFEAIRVAYLAVTAPATLRAYADFLRHVPEAWAARQHMRQHDASVARASGPFAPTVR